MQENALLGTRLKKEATPLEAVGQVDTQQVLAPRRVVSAHRTKATPPETVCPG